MKQYYQFMLRGVVNDAQGLQTNANIDDFEEDLHKMLVVCLSSNLAFPCPYDYTNNKGIYLKTVIVVKNKI